MIQEIIKENIVEPEQHILEAIRETKPIDYEDKTDKLNNTIDNLQSSINELSFNQIPAIQGKEIHEGITRTVSDPAITRQIEIAESQEEEFSTPVTTRIKKTHIHYDFDSNLNTYKDLPKEYKHTKPSTLFNDYTKKIIGNELPKDSVKEELRFMTQSTQTNAKKLGGNMKGVKKESDRYNTVKRKKVYLGLYRDALNTMHSATEKLTFSGTGLLYVYFDQMVERLYILLEHRKGGNNSDLLKNESGDINDILLKNNIIAKAQHKKIYK